MPNRWQIYWPIFKHSVHESKTMQRFWLALVLGGYCCMTSATPVHAQASAALASAKNADSLRLATYNVSLNRKQAGQLQRDLEKGDEQVRAIAAVIRAVRPDVLLVNELDYQADADNAGLLAAKLADSAADLAGGEAWPMPYHYSGPVNTGEPSGLDINGNGKTQEPEDAWGFGNFPGQYGMAVLSRYPIDSANVRTFQKLKWSSLPRALKPIDPKTRQPYYADNVWSELRISSKSFWDVPIQTPQGVLSLLASHPTPPAFDGPADHNGCRNHDEVRLLADYIDGDPDHYLVDDKGTAGGLAKDRAFVIAGDLNTDPIDGESRHEIIERILKSPRVTSVPIPASKGALEAHQAQGKANTRHRAAPENDTADFFDGNVGNLRVDYVLPSSNFRATASGVFWPAEKTDGQPIEVIKKLRDASDHHLVWVDVLKR